MLAAIRPMFARPLTRGSTISFRAFSTTPPAFSNYEYIKTETRGRVAIVTLNRPKALNALSTPLMTELNAALKEFDKDDNIGAMVVTGSEKAFAGSFAYMQLVWKKWLIEVAGKWYSWCGHQGDEQVELCGQLQEELH